MSGLDDTFNNSKGWCPRMSPPSSFDRKKQRDFQRKIDNIVGTKVGKPIVKLAWAPNELRWRPHAMNNDPPGFTFPIFFYGYDNEGKEIAAPRWVLLERTEPEIYGPGWEVGRFTVHEGRVWDWKGPCPSERYTEMWCHAQHNGECCPCRGETCECGEEYDHCWGLYRAPDEGLLNRLRRAVTRLAEGFEDQRVDRDKEKRDAILADLNKETTEYWLKCPKTIPLGMTETKSGLIVFNN